MKSGAFACVLIGCSASVPSELPRTSAASPLASTAPMPSVGESLRETEPPVADGGSAMPRDMPGMPGMSHGAP